MYNTSSVLECKVGKSPNITQTHSKANTGQDELYWVRPLGSLQYDRRAINWLLDYCGFSLLKYICSSTPTPFMTTIKYHVYNHVFFSYYRLANGQMISAWLSCLNSVQSKDWLADVDLGVTARYLLLILVLMGKISDIAGIASVDEKNVLFS